MSTKGADHNLLRSSLNNTSRPLIHASLQSAEVAMDQDTFEEITFEPHNERSNTLEEVEEFKAFPLYHGHAVKEPQQSLGALDTVPLELIQSTLSLVDIPTLQNFRKVNRRALKVVDSMPEYKAVATYAPNALRGIQSIEADRWSTCESLYKALCTAECETCGDFGGFLYLLTCKRVCFLCFTLNDLHRPISFQEATQKFGLRQRTLKKKKKKKNASHEEPSRRIIFQEISTSEKIVSR
ncbi:uncharacterized protein IWZ02DRAFT_484055 [Phyllosticta citriasiana]|uniref:uncharacterized protein n=1 Tax=Phyllosticta citriasiana TaxID=595635 RepID=UPI0030FDB8BA